MGKRSDFKRRPMDDYRTIDQRAVEALLPFIIDIRTFAEPCCGEFDLVKTLAESGLHCVHAGDLKYGIDAMDLDHELRFDAIITNPPWTRSVLHPMILHFQQLAPTWLLFDADWAHNKHAAPYLKTCSHIVSVGRLIWMPGTKMSGKDNCCWYRFWRNHEGPSKFYGRQP